METSISSVYTMCQQFCFLLSVHCHKYSQELHKVVQIEKVKLRNVKYLAPNHLASKDIGICMPRKFFQMHHFMSNINTIIPLL